MLNVSLKPYHPRQHDVVIDIPIGELLAYLVEGRHPMCLFGFLRGNTAYFDPIVRPDKLEA